MDGWLLALIIIVVIILIVIVIWALLSTPNVTIDISKGSSNNGSGKFTDLELAHINLSQQTSNFIQQAKCGYKGIKITFDQLNNLAKYIGDNIDKNGNLSSYLTQKNEIYKELTELIVVNNETILPDNHLLKHLNDLNKNIATILAQHSVGVEEATNIAKMENAYKEFMSLLHKYDVTVVAQMKLVADNEYLKAAKAAYQAQKIILSGS